MKVIASMQSPGSQLVSGLVSLLAGGEKESFASLLDTGETIHPELDNHTPPQQQQGDRGRRTSQKEPSEHAHVKILSGQQGDSAIAWRAPIHVFVDSQPKLSLGGARRDAQVEVGRGENFVNDGQSRKVGMVSVGVTGPIDESANALSEADAGQNVEENVSSLGSVLQSAQPHRIDKTSAPESPQPANSPSDSTGSAAIPPSFSEGDPSGLYAVTETSRGDLQIAGVEKKPGRPIKSEDTTPGAFQSTELATAKVGAETNSTEAESEAANQKLINSHAPPVSDVGSDMADRSAAHGRQVHFDAPNDAPKGSEASGSTARTRDEAGAELVNFGNGPVGHRTLGQADRASTSSPAPPSSLARETALPHAADTNAPRVLTNAMRGELHVGVHTEAFGRVTIQTSAGPGQFSAQVSLEDTKQSATLAAHFPAVEQRIMQQHGLNASVRIATDSQMGAGGNSTANGHRGSSANGGTREERPSGRSFGHSSSAPSRTSTRDIAGERQGRHLLSGGLDVRV